MFTQENIFTKHKLITVFALFFITGATLAATQFSIGLIPSTFSKANDSKINLAKINQIVQKNFKGKNYSKIGVQIIGNNSNQPDHLLVNLYSKYKPLLTMARVNITHEYQVKNILLNYHMQSDDLAEQLPIAKPVCPNDKVEFVLFDTGDFTSYIDEILGKGAYKKYFIDKIMNIARSHGLNAVLLYDKDATKQNFFDYALSPNLKCFVYSGHGSKDEITAVDYGDITYKDIKKYLKGKWKHVTNICSTCLAFNNPMHDAVIKDAGSPNYVAGINSLWTATAFCMFPHIVSDTLNVMSLGRSADDNVCAYGGSLDNLGSYSTEPFSYVKPKDDN